MNETAEPDTQVAESGYECMLCGQPVLREGAECFDCRKSRPGWLQAESEGEDQGNRRILIWVAVLVVVIAIAILAFVSSIGGLTERWSAETGGEIGAVVAVPGNCVLVGTARGEVVVMDEATGSERWRFANDEPEQVEITLGDVAVYCWSPANGVTALELRTGELLWQFAPYDGCGRPAVARDQILVTAAGEIVGLDGDGDVDWSWELDEGELLADVAAGIGVAYFGTLIEESGQGGISALDLHEQTPLWTTDLPGPLLGAPILVDRVVCATAGTEAGATTFGLDSATGEVLWQRKGAAGRAVARSGAVVVAETHAVLALDPATGAERWKTEHTEPELSGPLVTRDTLYFAGARSIYAVRALSGRKRWTEVLEVRLSALPAMGDGTLYWAAEGGTLHAALAQ